MDSLLIMVLYVTCGFEIDESLFYGENQMLLLYIIEYENCSFVLHWPCSMSRDTSNFHDVLFHLLQHCFPNY